MADGRACMKASEHARFHSRMGPGGRDGVRGRACVSTYCGLQGAGGGGCCEARQRGGGSNSLSLAASGCNLALLQLRNCHLFTRNVATHHCFLNALSDR